MRGIVIAKRKRVAVMIDSQNHVKHDSILMSRGI